MVAPTSFTGKAGCGAVEPEDVALIHDGQDPFLYADLYFSLQEKLEALLHRRVDLVEVQGIRNNFFRKVVDETKVAIYG